jgi:hypothetical protein
MKTNIVQIDLVKTRADWPADLPFAPSYLRKFKHGEPTDWSVLDKPIAPWQPLSWAQTYHDAYLRVPIFSYMLHRQTDQALAMMLMFGLEAAGQLSQPPQELLIVTGVPVELLYEADQQTYAGLQYHFGFAVR